MGGFDVKIPVVNMNCCCGSRTHKTTRANVKLKMVMLNQHCWYLIWSWEARTSCNKTKKTVWSLELCKPDKMSKRKMPLDNFERSLNNNSLGLIFGLCNSAEHTYDEGPEIWRKFSNCSKVITFNHLIAKKALEDPKIESRSLHLTLKEVS